MQLATVKPPIDRVRVASLTLAMFALALALRSLLFRLGAFRASFAAHAWEVGETVWKTGWAALLVKVIPFAWGHLGQAGRAGGGLVTVAGVLAVTGLGAARMRLRTNGALGPTSVSAAMRSAGAFCW